MSERYYTLKKSDCLDALRDIESESVDLIYLDPPFLTNKKHQLRTKDREKKYSFDDHWKSHQHYAEFMLDRMIEMHRVLKKTGTIFFHCDRSASHIARLLLDKVFGSDNFRSEIIWTYKRWSNSTKGLLPAHQNIYFYSKTEEFKFNKIFTEYSESTNLDQILQKRIRDKDNKSAYARDSNGDIIHNGVKKGVPLSDVWDIPYLNPKAKERVGYPTQKPLILLERIIELVTDTGDLVLDPFCGSGTTLVASKILGRNGIGIDESEDAIELSKIRLSSPVRTESNLLKKGRKSYEKKDLDELSLIKGIDFFPVNRNKGIDAFLKEEIDGNPVAIRIQKPGESIYEAIELMTLALSKKGKSLGIIIRTEKDLLNEELDTPSNVKIVESTGLCLKRILSG